VRIEQPAVAAPTVQREAVSIGPAVEADPVIWTARLRTGRVVIFQASGSKAFRAAALIAAVAAVEDSAVIALVVEDSVAAVIDLAAAGLAGLAGSAAAAAGSGAGAEN
jgi:hypothetical protein